MKVKNNTIIHNAKRTKIHYTLNANNIDFLSLLLEILKDKSFVRLEIKKVEYVKGLSDMKKVK